MNCRNKEEIGDKRKVEKKEGRKKIPPGNQGIEFGDEYGIFLIKENLQQDVKEEEVNHKHVKHVTYYRKMKKGRRRKGKGSSKKVNTIPS